MITEVLSHEQLRKPLNNPAFSDLKNWEVPAQNLGLTKSSLKKKYWAKLARYRLCLVQNQVYLHDVFSPIEMFLKVENIVFSCRPKNLHSSDKNFFLIDNNTYEDVINGRMSVKEMLALKSPAVAPHAKMTLRNRTLSSVETMQNVDMSVDDVHMKESTHETTENEDLGDEQVPQIPQPSSRKSAMEVYTRIRALKPESPPPSRPDHFIAFEEFEKISVVF